MNREQVAQVIKKHIANAVEGVDEDAIDMSKSMVDYGASSLDIVSVVSGSMRELKIKIPRTELKNIQTIDALVDAFMQSASN